MVVDVDAVVALMGMMCGQRVDIAEQRLHAAYFISPYCVPAKLRYAPLRILSTDCAICTLQFL